MAITAALVKELREKTGVGMMDCKKALQEVGGDMEKAIVYLREKGMARAAKKAGRIAAEGLVQVHVNDEGTAGVLLEVNCETDFVSKNDDFIKFTKDVAALALDKKAKTVEELASTDLNGKSVQDTLTGLIASIGENMTLRRVGVWNVNNGTIVGYTHMGGKIGSLVAIEGMTGDKAVEVGKDVAMHAAAAAPRYLKSDEVSTAELDQEKEIARKKLKEEGKPDDLIEKILVGQMNKFYKEVCLLDQPFVKDDKVAVGKFVKNNGGELVAFGRFQLGEGIEKKQENFAEEVAAQLK